MKWYEFIGLFLILIACIAFPPLLLAMLGEKYPSTSGWATAMKESKSSSGIDPTDLF